MCFISICCFLRLISTHCRRRRRPEKIQGFWSQMLASGGLLGCWEDYGNGVYWGSGAPNKICNIKYIIYIKNVYKCIWYTGWFFLLVPPQKVVPPALMIKNSNKNKKVRVKLCDSMIRGLTPTFTFLVGNLPSLTLRTFWGRTSKKNHPLYRFATH